MTDAEIAALVDSRIDAAFKARAWHDDARQDAIAKFFSEVRKQLRQEILTAVGELRAEVQIAKAAELRRDGAVVDLPALPLRRAAS